MNIISHEATMNSLDFLNSVINPARVESGESEAKNAHFVSRVEDELDDLPAVKIFNRFGNEVRTYDLTMKQMLLVGMRESKSVRRSVLAKLESMQEESKQPALPEDCVAIKKDDLIWLQGEVIERMKNQLKAEKKLKGTYKAKLEKPNQAESDKPDHSLISAIINYVRCNGRRTKVEIVNDRKELRLDRGKIPLKADVSKAVDYMVGAEMLIKLDRNNLDVERLNGGDVF